MISLANLHYLPIAADTSTYPNEAGDFQFDYIIAITWLNFIAFDIIMVNCLMSCCWPHISTGLL